MKNEELEKKKKAGNPIFIFVIFFILMAFIFYVPELYKKFNTNIANILGVGLNKEEEPKKDPNDNKDAMSDFVQIGSHESLTFNELKIDNIKLENKILTMTISSEENLELNDLDYYVEFYQNRSLFIGRRSLNGSLKNSITVNLDVTNLDVSTTTYIALSRIEESVIPKVDMPTDESGLGSLICIKNNRSYTYEFELNKLIKVLEKYNYTNYDLNSYSNELLKYQKKLKEINEYNGITASIAENENTFIYSCEFDYTNIQKFNKINDRYIFEKDMPNNIIKFKMEAEGFECE